MSSKTDSGSAPPLEPGGGGEIDGGLLDVSLEAIEDDRSVLALSGELDLSTIPRVEPRLFAELRARSGLVVDLSELSFIDSSGIAVLIAAQRASGEECCRMHTVVAAGSQVEKVFGLARIETALSTFPTREQAIEALDAGPA